MTTQRTVGNYALGPLLGRGGAGEVYAGEHRVFGDAIAIKLLRSELGEDETIARSFIAEAINARGLDHPNIVRVLDAGRDPETGRCYLVMQRVTGETLAARLRRDGRLHEAELRRIGAAIADGLAAAHARGIVHRDIKPGNVMVDAGQPTIVDFGIAKSLGGAPATITERRIGTPAYMAPEQLAEGLISPAVDVWALGVVLFQAATGRLPFENFADGRCPALVEDAPRARSLAEVSPALDDLIARCLSRSPSRRPSAVDVARALRGEPIATDDRVTEDLGPSTRVSPAPKRSRWIAGGAAVALVAAGIAFARARGEKPAADPATGDVASPGGSSDAVRSTPGSTDAATANGAVRAMPGSTDAAAGAIGAVRATPGSTGSATPSEPASSSSVVEVVVRSDPPGATITIDGAGQGVTPATLRVPLATVIAVRRPGYKPARVRVEKAGELRVRLVRVRPTTTKQPPHPKETLD
jgi:serine/threonine-protein kinase